MHHGNSADVIANNDANVQNKSSDKIIQCSEADVYLENFNFRNSKLQDALVNTSTDSDQIGHIGSLVVDQMD